MTAEERAEMIAFLTEQIWSYSETYFKNLSDDELQDRYNGMTEVEIDGQL